MTHSLRIFDLSFLLLMLAWSSPISAQTSCSEPGYSCNFDCTQLLLCVNGNQFSSNCPAGSFCNAAAGDCSATTCDQITCTTNTFKCTAAGTFPDPYSCSNFLTCLSEGVTPTNSSCPPNTVFEPCTSSCSRSFDCTPPRVRCNSNFDMGIVPGNAEMYYSCNLPTSCIPEIYKCADGMFYNSETQRCQSAGYDVCKEQPYTCINEGFYPDPRNCTVYYYCDPNLIVTVHACKLDFHYDQTAQGCLYGPCV